MFTSAYKGVKKLVQKFKEKCSKKKTRVEQSGRFKMPDDTSRSDIGSDLGLTRNSDLVKELESNI